MDKTTFQKGFLLFRLMKTECGGEDINSASIFKLSKM